MRDNFTLLRPATLDLAEHVGRSISAPDITQERAATLARIYLTMTPEAQQRAKAAKLAAMPAVRLVIDNTHGGDNA